MGDAAALSPRRRAPPRLAAWLLGAVLHASCSADVPTAPPSAAPMAGPAHCRFVVPEGLVLGDVRWSGACRSGLADGLGVLREYRQARVERLFYGRMAAGQPAIGVVDLGDGFMAGRFDGGQLVRDADRDTLIEAFDEASLAARQMAERFRHAGNAASARYYEGKAAQLARQID